MNSKKAMLLLILCVLVFYYYQYGGRSGPAVAVSDNMVIVSAGDLEGRLLAEGEFTGTLMLFGGTELPHRNAISPLFLAALDSADAGPIYAQYPDFHRCNSPGAELAKHLVQDINVIPSDRSTQTALVNALREFHHNLRSDGERVCVTVSGQSASLLAVRIPAAIMKCVSNPRPLVMMGPKAMGTASMRPRNQPRKPGISRTMVGLWRSMKRRCRQPSLKERSFDSPTRA